MFASTVEGEMMRFWPWMRLLVSVLFFAVALGGCGLFDSGPAATAKQFMWEVDKGKVDKAVERLTGQAVAMMGKEKMKAALTDNPAKKMGGIRDIEVQKEEVTGDTAVVELKVTYGNGETKTETMKLVRVDKQWKINVDASK
jgi:Domain of unknown function (DUF4878)